MKKILIVDDNPTNLKILKIILVKAGYEVIMTENPLEVISIMQSEAPNIVLLDINMPEMDGLELCSNIKKVREICDIPIIFVSALSETDDVVKGFSTGAVDYITKPYKSDEVRIRVATHLQIRDLQEKLTITNLNLEKLVKEQVKKIAASQMETIFSLAKLAQSRDDDTGSHLKRVQKYCSILATQLAKDSPYSELIDENFIHNIENASILHDIGKVGISDLILLKPGKLTVEEFEEMKKHTIIGFETLDEVHKKFGDNEFIDMGKTIARHHHEKWDGTGYPDKLKGDEIPLSARIMAIADVFDALSTKRVYKDAFDDKKCCTLIMEGTGTQFDPIIVDAFEQVADEFIKVRHELE